MKNMFAVVSLAAGLIACASPDEQSETPDAMPDTSLRDRLAGDDPVRLAVTPSDHAGTVTAALRSGGAWDGATVPLGLESGALAIRAGRDGRLELRELDLELAPITIPEDLVGQPAEFTQVRVALHAPVVIPSTWTGAESVRGAIDLELDMAWALAFAGTELPIGAPDLPPLAATLTISRTASGVHAALHLEHSGQLWMWAGLVELADVELALEATDRTIE